MKNNILIVTYFSYKDALIQSYVLPYLDIIRKNISQDSTIYLFTLEQEKHKMSSEEYANEEKKLNERNIHLVSATYRRFGILTIFKTVFNIFKLFLLCKRKKINCIHCFCLPAGAIGYLLSVITNIKLIIDSYEPHAETMLESGTWAKNSIAFRILFKLEYLQSHRASELIACTPQMEEYAREKYNLKRKITLYKPACVDLTRFKATEKNPELLAKHNLQDKIVCICSGKLGGYYMREELFDFMKVAQDFWGDKFRMLFLTSDSKESLLEIARKKNIREETFLCMFVPFASMPDYLNLGDFAFNHTLPVKSRRYGTPIKDGEYWAVGIPVIIAKEISDDSDIIAQNNIGYVLDSLSPQEYTKAVSAIDNIRNTHSAADLKKKIRNIAEYYRSYSIADQVYSRVYTP